MRSPLAAVAAATCTLLVTGLTGAPAWADATYPSEHIALQPVGTAPLRSGFVQNIHTNGPTVYALERYALAGAQPGSYTVTLQLFTDTLCMDYLGPFPSITFATNAAGNGVGRLRLPPSAIPVGFNGATIGVVWELDGDTGASYTTDCSTVVLD